MHHRTRAAPRFGPPLPEAFAALAAGPKKVNHAGGTLQPLPATMPVCPPFSGVIAQREGAGGKPRLRTDGTCPPSGHVNGCQLGAPMETAMPRRDHWRLMAKRMSWAGSMRWSWESSPVSTRTQLMVPVKALLPAW